MTVTVTARDRPGAWFWRWLGDPIGKWSAGHRTLLLALTALGGVAAVVSPWLWVNLATEDAKTTVLLFPNASWWIVFRGLSILVGVMAVLAVIGDKLGDRWEAKVASLTVQEGERRAEASILQLNVVLNEAIRTLSLTNKSRQDALEALRRIVANQAAQSVGDGSRATSYNLRREADDRRVLESAEHGVVGRRDKPNKPFYERLHPDLEIWRMLDREDDEPDVRSYPEAIEGLDWEAKKGRYLTFFSVPVKAGNVQLGMLSVNNKEIGAIGGPQRAVIIAMAKVLALANAAAMGPRMLCDEIAEQSKRDGIPGMSEPGDTVTTSGEGNAE